MDPSAQRPPPRVNLPLPPHASLPNHFPRTPCSEKAAPAIPRSAFSPSSQSLSPLAHPELQRKPLPPLVSRTKSRRRLVLFAIDSAPSRTAPAASISQNHTTRLLPLQSACVPRASQSSATFLPLLEPVHHSLSTISPAPQAANRSTRRAAAIPNSNISRAPESLPAAEPESLSSTTIRARPGRT